MKPAHWARVTKQISEKFGIPFKDAKSVFNKLKETEARQPSLRMVGALPKRLPAKYEGVRTKPKNTKSNQKPVSPKLAVSKGSLEQLLLPLGVKLAPPFVRAEARKVPEKQSAKTRFEKMLKDRGLPVRAIANGPLGREVIKEWRNPALQEKIANQLKLAYKQIEKYGIVKKGTRDRIEKLMSSGVATKLETLHWNSILSQLYGRSKKGK